MIGYGAARVRGVGMPRRSFRAIYIASFRILSLGPGILMKKILIAAAALLGATAAQAADMAARPYAKAPPLSPAYNWTGFYVGVNAGYGFGDEKVAFAGGDPLIQAFTSGTGFGTGSPIPSASSSVKSATGGIQLGYNLQIAPQWLAGLETDFNAIDLNASTASVFDFGIRSTNTIAASQKADWFGTFRGRIGWLPKDNLLIYGTGGLAYGQIKEAVVFNQRGSGGGDGGGFGYECNGTGAACFAGSSSRIAAGYAVGAGLEYGLSRNITLKAEYLYVDLGSTSTRAVVVVPRTGLAPASFVANFDDFSFNVVRGGLNYRF